MKWNGWTSRVTRRSMTIGIALATASAAVVTTAAMASAASTSLAANTGPAAVRQCSTGSLEVWLGLGAGEQQEGALYLPIEFTNVSHQTCDLHGYPGVSAVRDGRQVGSAASRDPLFPPRTVTLAPGATAHAFFALANVYDFPSSTCHPVTATQLKVYPPNQYSSAAITYSFPACSTAGPLFLNTRVVTAGSGIPGHNAPEPAD